jgi:hypothetical protein
MISLTITSTSASNSTRHDTTRHQVDAITPQMLNTMRSYRTPGTEAFYADPVRRHSPDTTGGAPSLTGRRATALSLTGTLRRLWNVASPTTTGRHPSPEGQKC